MVEFILRRSSHNEFRRRRFPDRGVFAGLPIPGGVLFPYEPTGLMREPVGCPGKHSPPLVPNNLLEECESNPLQAVQHFAGKDAGVPHIRNLEACLLYTSDAADE